MSSYTTLTSTAADRFASRAERRRIEKALRKAPRPALVALAAQMNAENPQPLLDARRRLRAYVTPGTNMAELYASTDRETIGRRFASDLLLVLEAIDRLDPVR